MKGLGKGGAATRAPFAWTWTRFHMSGPWATVAGATKGPPGIAVGAIADGRKSVVDSCAFAGVSNGVGRGSAVGCGGGAADVMGGVVGRDFCSAVAWTAGAVAAGAPAATVGG